MPRQRFQNLPASERQRLLDIASRHFTNAGYERASLNEILAEAGISKGAYYYYFDDKEDLFATVLEAGFEALISRVPVSGLDQLARSQFWPAVEKLLQDWAANLDTSGNLFQLVLQLDEEQRRSPRISQLLEKASFIYRAIIEPGRKLGCIRTDLSIDALVRLVQANDAALDALYLSRHSRMDRANVDAHARLVFDTFRRLLAIGTNDGVRATRPRGRRSG